MSLTDLAAERAVLGGICSNGYKSFIDVDAVIRVRTFSDPTNQVIFRVLGDIYSEDKEAALDIALIFSRIQKLSFEKIFEKKSELEHLKAVLDTRISEGNTVKFAKLIRTLEVSRLILKEVKGIESELVKITGNESLPSILSLVETPVFNLTNTLVDHNESDPKSLVEDGEAYLKYLAENPRELIGISTGFPRYDRLIGGGLRRKSVNMIGARPKTGKSVLASQISAFVANQNLPVLYLDTEMSRDLQQNRLYANQSGVTINDIETGKFAQDSVKHRAVMEAAKRISKIPYYYLNISGQPFEETIATMRRWLVKSVGTNENGNTKDCLIVIDYLKLMTDDGLQNMQEFQKLGFAMTELHNFTVKYDLPVLAFCQLNREGINSVETDSIAGSDRISWLCTSLSLFKKKSSEEVAEEGPENGNRKLIPILSRHGEGMDSSDWLNMDMRGEIAKVTELHSNREFVRRTNSSVLEDMTEEDLEV